MQTKAILLACLAAASSAIANAQDPSTEFFSSVNRTFIANSFAGLWSTDCTPNADGATTSQTLLVIDSEGRFERIDHLFEDGNCSGSATTQHASGTLQLQTTGIDVSGKSFYAMSMGEDLNAARFYLENDGSLNIVGADLSSAFKKLR